SRWAARCRRRRSLQSYSRRLCSASPRLRSCNARSTSRAVGAKIATFEVVRRDAGVPQPRPATFPTTSPRRRVGRSLRPVHVLRAILAGLAVVSSDASASFAELAFRRPKRNHPSRGEQKRLDGGRLSWLRGDDGDLAVWHWGSGPRVLLVHGWGGHAG